MPELIAGLRSPNCVGLLRYLRTKLNDRSLGLPVSIMTRTSETPASRSQGSGKVSGMVSGECAAEAPAPLYARILREATRLFALRGFSGTHMREVAEACGCTKPALYYHFSNKETLFKAVVDGITGDIDGLMVAMVEGEGSVRDRLHYGIDAIIAYCRAEPLTIRLVQRLEASPEETSPADVLCKARATHMNMLATLMRHGIKTGELSAPLDPEDAALLFASCIHFQMEQSVATDEWDVNRVHRTLDLIFDGIAK